MLRFEHANKGETMSIWIIIPWGLFWIALVGGSWFYKKAEKKRVAQRRERFRKLRENGPVTSQDAIKFIKDN